LSDEKQRKIYDQYGEDGVNAAAQNNGEMPGGFGGSGGGVRHSHGGMGGMHGGHMSDADAQAFFASFFGGSDPFMSGFAGGGMPRGGQRSPFGSMPGGFPPGMHGSMGGGMRRSPEPKRYDAIPADTIVSLKGLVNAADRNGDRGKIASYNASTGRYVVELEDTDETMSVKPSNLLQHVHVRIHGLQSKPQLNGKTGTVITWNESTERYNIYITALKQVVSLKPSNVILEQGTVGKITALSSKPELNGKWGTITTWNAESNRYDIQLSAHQVIRIKAENLRV
jgi:curved DNA-binding protein CbpA